MPSVNPGVVVGLDVGGTSINATVLDGFGVFLVESLHETPSRVLEGPAVAVEALAEALDGVLASAGLRFAAVRAVGLDTPGPASADGVISSKGGTNFNQPAWHGFDVRGALETRLGLPVVYTNDANAAALYAHHVHFGADADGGPRWPRSSAPGWAAAWWRAAGWSGAPPGWPASSATCRSRCTAAGGGPAGAGVQLRLRRATRRASPR